MRQDESEFALSEEVADIFVRLGFPVPNTVPLMKCEYQIAQKLHGLTEPKSRRAHDLVDLQLIVERSKVDFTRTAKICRRLFAFRRMQPWPPKVIKGTDWDSLYAISNLKKAVPRSVDEAIDWANDFIGTIDKSLEA